MDSALRQLLLLDRCPYFQGAQESEDIPNRAIEFLELVNPRISITAAKHDYWETSFKGLASAAYDGLDEDDASVDIDPADWEKEGSGHWHDAVDGDLGWDAYRHFLAGGSPKEVRSCHESLATLLLLRPTLVVANNSCS